MEIMVGQRKKTPFRSGIVVMAGLLAISFAALLAARLISGRGLGLRSMPYAALSLVRAVLNQEKVASTSEGNYTNILFLHQSTGNNLIEQGGVRELFTAAGYDFWDHSYNNPGLRNPEGKYTGYAYNVPRNNTAPDGFADIFSQRVFEKPVNTLSALMQHEVIIFKSCFAPANHITSDRQLQQYKDWYRGMRGVMDQHPEKLFVVVTPPPLNPSETNADEAARARQFANWLKSEAFLGGRANITTFDFYALLAEEDPASPEVNMLRKDYRWGADSHPIRVANEALGPVFVDFVMDAVEQFRAR
jgi:hypothetical protein